MDRTARAPGAGLGSRRIPAARPGVNRAVSALDAGPWSTSKASSKKLKVKKMFKVKSKFEINGVA
ncbi:hypothetical protein [Acerihabitans sp.]|uniref:hypothetical protein n=1 Tax=Acerihabitans sp. TaxID=2811394 RepID=UPI002EDAB913